MNSLRAEVRGFVICQIPHICYENYGFIYFFKSNIPEMCWIENLWNCLLSTEINQIISSMSVWAVHTDFIVPQFSESSKLLLRTPTLAHLVHQHPPPV